MSLIGGAAAIGGLVVGMLPLPNSYAATRSPAAPRPMYRIQSHGQCIATCFGTALKD